MALETVEKYLGFKKICEQILGFDPAIRLAVVITDKGNVLTGKSRTDKFLVDRNTEMLYGEVALRVRMRREFDQELGPVNFSLSHRKNVVILSFPFENDRILFVSADTFIDLGKTPFKILEIFRNTGSQSDHVFEIYTIELLIKIGRELWDMTNGYEKQPVLISKLSERLNIEESKVSAALRVGEKIGLMKSLGHNQICISTLGSFYFTRN